MSDSLLLKIARASIAEVFEANNTINREELLQTYPILKEEISSFVTIYLNDELRGCVGSVIPTRSLLDDIIHNAKAAAFEDKRFSPLKTSEYLHAVIELALLTPPKELSYSSIDDIKEQVNRDEDGLIISLGDKQAALLPQIWSQLKNFEDVFAHLLQEADLQTSDLSARPQVFTFQVEKQRDTPILQ